MKTNILVVDDTRDNLRLLSNMLTEQGYKVRPVSDGRRAISSAQNRLPDLILLDIMIPKIDGFEVCRQIKANEATRHIPVIMLSAKKSREDRIMGEQAGADLYITKPYKSDMLIETIQRLLS